ncbi:ester cyclase [Nocardia sp. NPDC058058]|uniref:ester cyclase n=1 Tax=Nocardia sp. NPDC058058 TaxID=3346317 RepID=UPI0036DDA8C7
MTRDTESAPLAAALTADELVEAIPELIANVSTRLSASSDMLRDWSRAWLRAWNTYDADAALALVTPDFEYLDPSMFGDAIVGRAAFRDFLDMMWHAFPDMAMEIPATPYVPLTGTGLAVPWRLTGTFTGELRASPELTIAATGRAFDIHGIDLYTYRDGLLSQWTSVADQLDLARQLGLIPDPHSRQVRYALRAQRLVAPLFTARRKR